MIISGGFNIYPSDLEAEITQHPAVLEAAVVGVPSDQWGETPVAFVSLRPGQSETAEALIRQYSAKDGSIKFKDAVLLINRVLPQTSTGNSVQEALENAGITSIPPEAALDKIKMVRGVSGGAFGAVFEIRDHGTPCLLKRQIKPLEIQLSHDGGLLRGNQMDGNQLAAGKVPGVIAPNRYLLSKTDALGSKSYHVVTAGGHFKQFCKEANSAGDTLWMEGLVMDKAKGAQMRETISSSSNQKEIARGFLAILLNASSRGIVFGDIKEENAFVDGGKVTLIDTDAAFKHSRDESKVPKKPSLSGTYIHPAGAGGQQQDLFSLGMTLLEHTYRSQGTDGRRRADQLYNAGAGRDGDANPLKPMDDKLAGRLSDIQSVVGQPREGSVEDFAMLCIRTALDVDKNYNTRFTGKGNHLLDPLLDHVLIGGREAFVTKHLVKSDAGSSSEQLLPLLSTKQGSPELGKVMQQHPGSIHLETEKPETNEQQELQEKVTRMMNRNSDSSDDSDTSSVKSKSGDSLLKFIAQQLSKNRNAERADRDSDPI
jgi:serine/threonine protein kinase